MNDVNELVERYVASWNEPDPVVRRGVIDEVWAADGVYRNARREFIGRSGIEDAVAQAHQAFCARGFVFKVRRIDRNHDALRYVWEMVPVLGGEPDSIGTHVAMVGLDGRLVSDHQFIDRPPSPR